MAAKSVPVEQLCFYRELGKQIRKYREQQGLTQKDMSVHLGVTYQQYQKYEVGENRIGVWVLYKISLLLDVSFAEIVFPQNPENILHIVSDKDVQQHIDFLSEYIANMRRELLG